MGDARERLPKYGQLFRLYQLMSGFIQISYVFLETRDEDRILYSHAYLDTQRVQQPHFGLFKPGPVGAECHQHSKAIFSGEKWDHHTCAGIKGMNSFLRQDFKRARV